MASSEELATHLGCAICEVRRRFHSGPSFPTSARSPNQGAWPISLISFQKACDGRGLGFASVLLELSPSRPPAAGLRPAGPGVSRADARRYGGVHEAYLRRGGNGASRPDAVAWARATRPAARRFREARGASTSPCRVDAPTIRPATTLPSRGRPCPVSSPATDGPPTLDQGATLRCRPSKASS